MQSNSGPSGARHLNYLDFELEIGSGRGREYPVAVVRSPAGEAREIMRFPYNELALENRLKDLRIALLRSGGRRRRVLSPEERNVQDFGRDLFNALLFSSAAAILVRRGIPAVLAMQYEITDRAAIEFACAFYEALADEMPVDAAVAEARKAVSLAVTNTVEWGTPVLFMRSPDKVLFTSKRQGPGSKRRRSPRRTPTGWSNWRAWEKM